MILKKIKITNFKSIYGTQEFNFETLDGLVKLSGPIGAGKTTVGESILWGLYGNVKGQTNPGLVSWNCKSCEVELNLISKGKAIRIVRNTHEPLIIEVDGKTVAASNKRDTQEILEDEIFDVPKLAVQKMCVISFNAFNSLAAMSPSETKTFLDEIFGFKLFSEYNNEVVVERKIQQNENVKLNAIYNETIAQIEFLKTKKVNQQRELENSLDITALNSERSELVTKGVSLKEEYTKTDNDYLSQETEIEKRRMSHYNKKMEYAMLGKQEKEWVTKFKDGICPTCGQAIDVEQLSERKSKLQYYVDKYKEEEAKENEVKMELAYKKSDHSNYLNQLKIQMDGLRTQISAIDSKIIVYNNNLKLINENYDDLILEYKFKAEEINEKLTKSNTEITQWNEMNELFTKTLRYSLLETLIPHINKSIKYFIRKLDQTFRIEYDQEFKPHIFTDTYDKEITYNNLSTGQKKSLDMAIIFGVLQNIISNVEFNVFFLDELFSNLDSDSRNIMLELLKDTLGENRTIFVINHAEMNDDYFNHKIRVGLVSKKITAKNKTEMIVKSSNYTNIF